MEYFNPNYLTIDKLSENSLHMIGLRLQKFLHRYDIKEYPINCFDLLDRIIASKTINLMMMENDKFSDSLDAAAIYSGKKYGYCIMFNSNKKGSFNYAPNRRCNFTIAHELGHIFLDHLLIPRSMKTAADKAYEDWEADEFAGRLLMPEKLLLQTNFISGVTADFLVSSQALYIRVNNLKRLDLYTSVPVATCKSCGNTDISPSAEYCKTCGTKINSTTTKGIKRIYYSSSSCPKCQNDLFTEEVMFCRVCGTALYNECNNCGHVNDANARYCEQCGLSTVFFGLLLDWKTEREHYIKSLVHENCYLQ